MIKNPITKNILSALAIIVFGFLLLNISFVIDFLFHFLAEFIMGILFPKIMDHSNSLPWYAPLIHILFALLIVIISIFVFKSKIGPFYKATFMTVPVAVILATMGILFYQMPFLIFLIGGLFTATALYFFWQKRLSWLYYYALIIVVLALLISFLTGGEI